MKKNHKKTVFDFYWISNSIGNKKLPISFKCPVCNKINETIAIYEYTPYHEFYEGIEFFCGFCLSQFVTLPEEKIKLISGALII